MIYKCMLCKDQIQTCLGIRRHPTRSLFYLECPMEKFGLRQHETPKERVVQSIHEPKEETP